MVLTNFYPPHSIGGQEQSCQQVVEGLRQRGHEIQVLTSRHASVNSPTEQDGIYRSLFLEMDLVAWSHNLVFFTRRKAREKYNLQTLKRQIRHFEPDIIFIWGMWNLPRSLPVLAEAACPGRVVYRFAEYWPTLPSQHELYWQRPGRTWYSRLIKILLRRIALRILAREKQPSCCQFEHTICVSEATHKTLQEAGIAIPNARIIHTGIEGDIYSTSQPGLLPRKDRGKINLLYAGRLAEDKGVDTAIRAVGNLVHQQGVKNIHLHITGTGRKYYENSLRQIVSQTDLKDFVSFLGHVPYSEMPKLFHRNDILLVPSIWPEPFARILLEGMASGLVVIATQVGGTSELIQNGENGLLFPPGDHAKLADLIACSVTDPEFSIRLARSGQQTIKEKYPFSKMVDEIENYLLEVRALWQPVNFGKYPAVERMQS